MEIGLTCLGLLGSAPWFGKSTELCVLGGGLTASRDSVQGRGCWSFLAHTYSRAP